MTVKVARYVWILGSALISLDKLHPDSEQTSKGMNERKDAQMCVFVHCCDSTLAPQFAKNPVAMQLSLKGAGRQD